jgi:hypothetical protein
MNRVKYLGFLILFLVLVCSFGYCTTQSDNMNEIIVDTDSFKNLDLREPSGFGMISDLFFNDSVITKNRCIVMLGIDNKSVKTYTKTSVVYEKEKSTYGINLEIPNIPLGGYLESTYSSFYQAPNPSWIPFNEHNRQIQSMTMNPFSRDIFLLTEKTDLPAYDAYLLPKKELITYQVIEVVIHDLVEKSFTIKTDYSLSKIRYCHSDSTNAEFLVAADETGKFYFSEILDNGCSFNPLVNDYPIFQSWDISCNVLVGLDMDNMIHLYTSDIDDKGNLTFNGKANFINPIGKNMKKPAIQYNPSTKCIVLWESEINGKSAYAIYNEDLLALEWKSLKVTPMSLFMYSDAVLNQAPLKEDLSGYDLWSATDHFKYIGVRNSGSQLEVFRIYVE